MDIKTELTKLSAGGIAATVIKYPGDSCRPVILLMCFMAADTLLGWLGAIKKGEWKSCNARWGAVGKLTELIIISLMYLCEWTFGTGWLIYTVTLYFIICEGASIVENIVKYHLNDNIPEGLADILSRMKTNFVGFIIKKLKSIFEGDDKNG